MTRSLRIVYPGAFYHITSRGNGKRDIFRSDLDRRMFLVFLSRVLEKYNWKCHAYCLMGNHYHLLIKTIDPTISRGMQDLNGGFTQWFNAEHKSVGHILQGRFHSSLIEEHEYFLVVARYIVLNPVRANMVAEPADYVWSSYRATAGIDRKPVWLTTKNVLDSFSANKIRANGRYVAYVQEGIGLPSPFEQSKKGGILGSQQFIDETRDVIEGRIKEKEYSIEQRLVGRPSLETLFEGVKNRDERNVGIGIAVNGLQYSAAEVGRFLGLDRSTGYTMRRDLVMYT